MNLLEQRKKILKKIRTGFADSKQQTVFDTISVPANIKFDFIHDGDVLAVYHVPITKVGVQEYSDGMHFKTEDAVRNIASDFSPLSIYHPRVLFRDMPDETVQDLLVGWSSDGYFDEATKTRMANFYFIVDALKQTAPGQKILSDIEAQRSTDVSIGFVVDVKDEAGVYEGQKYDKQQTIIVHDHTAVLPGAQGRYSFSQGIGIGANATGGGNVSKDDKTDSKPDVAADAIRAQLTSKDEALRKADEARQAAEKAAADAKAEAEKLRKAEADRLEKEKKSKVDAIMTRITPEGKEQDAAMREHLMSLDEKGLGLMDKQLGENVQLVDNKLSLVEKTGKDERQKSNFDQYTDRATEAQLRKYVRANGMDSQIKADSRLQDQPIPHVTYI